MTWVNGRVYKGGGWVEDEPNGQGECFWEDGSQYKGDWQNGKRTGYGVYVSVDGEIIPGEWIDNKIIVEPEKNMDTILYEEGIFVEQ